MGRDAGNEEEMVSIYPAILSDPLFERATVIGNGDHRFLIREQMAEIAWPIRATFRCS